MLIIAISKNRFVKTKKSRNVMGTDFNNQETNKSGDANVVQMAAWKNTRSAKIDLNTESDIWVRYYKTVDFHSLTSEANDLIMSLEKRDLTREDWLRARAIMLEIETRLKADKRPEAMEIRTMASELEERIERLAFL